VRLAFDTNHLVRYLVQDDEAQCAIVAAIIEKESRKNDPILLLDLVLLETNWVLESAYGVSRDGWAEIFENLLNEPIFSFEDTNRLRLVLQRFRKGKADFGDYMILTKAKNEGCELKTFDKKLLRDSG
jgi:predicted nucleic-acid-binding protein